MKTEQNLLGILSKFCPHFDDHTFTIVYRIGKKQKDTGRPIIARFHHLKDKILLRKSQSGDIQQ